MIYTNHQVIAFFRCLHSQLRVHLTGAIYFDSRSFAFSRLAGGSCSKNVSLRSYENFTSEFYIVLRNSHSETLPLSSSRSSQITEIRRGFPATGSERYPAKFRQFFLHVLQSAISVFLQMLFLSYTLQTQ